MPKYEILISFSIQTGAWYEKEIEKLQQHTHYLDNRLEDTQNMSAELGMELDRYREMYFNLTGCIGDEEYDGQLFGGGDEYSGTQHFAEDCGTQFSGGESSARYGGECSKYGDAYYYDDTEEIDDYQQCGFFVFRKGSVKQKFMKFAKRIRKSVQRIRKTVTMPFRGNKVVPVA